MTQFSSWSESGSGVTTDIGLAPVGEDACGHSDASSSSGRCVIPKVQPAVNGSDQRVPVYWDQTVPVWPSCQQGDLASCKRKSAHTPSGSRHGECYNTVYLRSSPKNRGNEEVHNGDCGRQSGNAAGISSKKQQETTSR